MYSLFRKEIAQFFHTLAGYIVVAIFLLASSLFLWVLPGEFNIIDGKIASLKGLFDLAPWVYLFLIPAITMRMFAEERSLGTFDLLLTRPIPLYKIIGAKFLASVMLVIFSLLPTLIFVYSVSQLGHPVSNIDSGATLGSYIGLLLLSAIYCAIGLFASAISKSQINAFLIGLLLCFGTFIGFDYISELVLNSQTATLWEAISVNQHYLSISRGVVDTRDILFFLCSSFLFLLGTYLFITPKVYTTKQIALKGTLLIVALFIGNKVSDTYFARLDLTAEQRYSVDSTSKRILQNLPFSLHIQIYLDGKMPAGMRQLRDAMIEKSADLKAYANKNISTRVIDPYTEVEESDQKKFFEFLQKKGLQPTNLQVKEETGSSNHWIFPGMILRGGGKEVVINALKNNPTLSAQQNLTISMEMLEFEFMRAIKLLTQNSHTKIGFLQGHNELNEYQVRDISNSLAGQYEFSHITAQQLKDEAKEPRVLIIADPEIAFSEKDKYEIDQFIMRGGRVLWMIDPVQVSLDSLQNAETTLAYGRDLNLTDQLFRYGVRINPDLIQDIDCMLIPINMNPPGQQADFKPMPWYFSPLVNVNQSNPIGKGLNRLMSEFVSTVEVVGKNKKVRSEVILQSSPYARAMTTPLEVNLSMIQDKATKETFRHSNIPVGVSLEGSFESNYKNRMLSALGIRSNKNTLVESKPTKMIVIGDGNLIANKYKITNGKPEFLPLGYDRFSKTSFGNRAFFINAIEYLTDDSGIMQLSNRVIQHRPLDKVKLSEETKKWQLINVVLPLLILSLLGAVFVTLRKRKYSY